MKRILFVAGTSALMLLLLGYLFSFLHYKGSGLLVIFGLTLFFLVLVAGAIKFRNLLFYSSSLGFLLLLFSWLFRTFHWPGDSLFFIGGMLILALIVIPLFGYWIYKHSG